MTAEEFIQRHTALVTYLIKKHGFFPPPGADWDDLMQEGRIALLRAYQTYDPAHGAKVSVYAAKCILNSLWYFIRRNADPAGVQVVSLDDTVRGSKEGKRPLTYHETIPDTRHDLTEGVCLRAVVNEAVADPILSMKLQGYHQVEIAKILGVSQASVSRWLKRRRNKLQALAN